MYKDEYPPIEGKPLTETVPMLLKWRDLSLHEVQKATERVADEQELPEEDRKKVVIYQATWHRILRAEIADTKQPTVEKMAKFFGLTYFEILDPMFVRRYVSGRPGKPNKGLPSKKEFAKANPWLYSEEVETLYSDLVAMRDSNE